MKMLFMRLRILFISGCVLIAALAMPSFAFCADADMGVNVDVREITIGDIINYKVMIALPVDHELKDPFVAVGSFGEFEIRDFKWSVEQDKMQSFLLEYALSIFKTGKHMIPEYTIEYRGSSTEPWQVLRAKAIDITVQSTLGDAKDPSLKPLKSKVIVWRDYWPGLIILILIVAVICAGFKFWQARHKPVTEQVVVEAAHVIAYRELDQLERENFITRGLIEEYYEKLSGCLRRYLENRFFLRAPWMSTEEFLKEVRVSPVLNTPQRTALKDFLKLADLVKFARYCSSVKEAGEAFAGAKSFVDQTKFEDGLEEKTKT